MHIPVLLREVVELLAPRSGETVIDCTAGLGGHAAAMAERVGAGGSVVLFDLDAGNLQASARRLAALPSPPRVVTHHGSFAEVGRVMGSGGGVSGAARGLRLEGGKETSLACAQGAVGLGAVGQGAVLLADLGFASSQVDDAGRGFSFMREGPLDMRLNPLAPISASELVHSMGEQELMELIRDVGEEPQPIARRIAAKVVQERKVGPILTTVRLAEIVRAALPAGLAARNAIHPATKTFQALRIAVNDEIGSLQRLLDSIGRAAQQGAAGKDSWLAPGARVGIISFHSLEDRPVKQCFADLAERGLVEPVTKKPVTAGAEEVAANPRSRSAKLRVVRLVGVVGGKRGG